MCAAAKPIIDKAQPYINAVWTHLEPHAATSRTHINTFFHGKSKACADYTLQTPLCNSLSKIGFV